MKMQRISVKRKRPNALFEMWLAEWQQEAGETMKCHFSKALASLEKYPLPLKTGQECIILQNFGSKLCQMLDKRLEQHKTTNNYLEVEPAKKCPKPVITGAKAKPKKTRVAIEKIPEPAKPQIRLSPGTFDVVLLVDIHETNSGTVEDFTPMEINYEVRHLKVGDFAWVARCKTSKDELVLPYIVERKRHDDLGSSIKDGRFHEQKFRLKQSGIPNIIYMVEGLKNDNKHTSLPLSTLLQASINSLVQDDFTLKLTSNHSDSMMYLARLTKALERRYQNKLLIEVEKENIRSCSVSDECIELMEFQKFNKTSSKVKTYKVKEMFVRQLLQLKGLSLDRALAIVEHYPTPLLLREAFLKAGPQGETLLSSLTFGKLKRKFGPGLSRTLYQLYTSRDLK